MKRKVSLEARCFLSLIVFVLLCAGVPVFASAEERPVETVRVACPLQAGLLWKDDRGTLSGYTYDYLMELSQYTGWSYEFVFYEGTTDEQITAAMEQLKAGEVDLMGAMYYDASLTTDYAYPGYCYGINYSGLFVPENSKLRESSLYHTEFIRVGVHSKALQKSERLEQFAQMNHLNIEQVLTQSAEEYYAMLEDGRVDALLSTDVTMAASGRELEAIVHFSPMPFYFATTQGNTRLIRQLDDALSTIDQVDPNFMSELNNRYFSTRSSAIVFTEEETEYIKTCGTREVVLYDNRPPFSYLDGQTQEPVGITVEVLEKIGEITGLQFRYNTVSTYQEYLDYVRSGKADIAADLLISYQDAQETQSTLTMPWFSLPISMLYREDPEKEDGLVAVPYFLRNVVPASANAVYYDTVKECMEAVREGRADFCYAGELCSQYYYNSGVYNSLEKRSRADLPNQKICFGVCNTGDVELHTILNKGINALTEDTVNEIVYRNTYRQQELSLLAYLWVNRNLLLTLLLCMTVVGLLAFFVVIHRRQRRIVLENRRYNAISNLANEYFYEYDRRTDELTLSEKCADCFGCEHKINKFSKKLSEMEPENRTGIWQLGGHITGSEEGSFEAACHMPDEAVQWYEVVSSFLSGTQKEKRRGSEMLAVGKIINIQQRKIEQKRLEEQAELDGLTGIYNIAAFKKRIGERLAKTDVEQPGFLMILDIDDFKQVNDRFGHGKGDAVLVQAASLISGAFPDGLSGRLGGDEFVAYVSGVPHPELEEMCGLLCLALRNKTKGLLGTAFGWSIGIAGAEAGCSYKELYAHADAALYHTKQTTKDGYSFYQPKP